MNVIVESNFVLELAFQQEEVGPAEQLIAMAVSGAIELAVPACSLFEPFETLVRRRKERTKTLESFRNQIRQLGRSAHFPGLSSASEGVALVMAESVETEAASLDRALLRVLDCAEVIPLSAEIMRDSLRVRERFSVQPQDSVVFASADWYLNQRGRADSIFANKNSTDFAVPEVESHFQSLNCKVLATFADALGVIAHRARTV